MNDTANSADIGRRLDELQARIVEKKGQLAKGNVSAGAGSDRASELHGRSVDIKQRVEQNSGSAWQAVKNEVTRDVEALENDFDHWVRYIDKHFKE